MPSNTKEYMKKYYTVKKETILKRMKEPIMCEICNTNITRSNFQKHLTSRKHIKLVDSNKIKNVALDDLMEQMKELKKMIERVENKA